MKVTIGRLVSDMYDIHVHIVRLYLSICIYFKYSHIHLSTLMTEELQIHKATIFMYLQSLNCIVVKGTTIYQNFSGHKVMCLYS